MNPIEELLIKKCRTDPYLSYPQFDRYLTGGQLKVVNCLLRAGGANSKAFPSNDRIAWETGLKIDSVRVIKCELGKLGVISKQEIKRGVNTIWIYTVDTTWKREQYRTEFDERYNSRKVGSTALSAVKEEIARLQQALNSASPDDMLAILERIKSLALQMKDKNQDAKPASQPALLPEPSPPIDEAFIDYIVEQTPNVQNKYAYKAKVKRLLCAGELDGIDEYKQGYEQCKRIIAIAKRLEGATVNLYGEKRSFDGEVIFDDESATYVAYFGGYKVAVSQETVKAALKGIT
jgi:hypothetical protein